MHFVVRPAHHIAPRADIIGDDQVAAIGNGLGRHSARIGQHVHRQAGGAASNGQAVVLVTHNPDIANRCDEIKPMRDGLFC